MCRAGFSKYVKSVIAVAVLTSKAFLRSKAWWIASISTPISMLIIFYLLMGVEAAKNVIAGAVVAAIWGSGIVALPQEIVGLKASKRLDMLLTSVPSLLLLIGLAVGCLMSDFPILALFTSSLIALNPSAYTVLALVLSLLLTLFTASSIGLLIGLMLKDPINAMGVTNALYALTVVLAPVYYPIEILPQEASKVLILLPTAASAQVFKNLLGMSNYMFTESAISLTIWTALTIAANIALWRGHVYGE